MTYMSVNIHFSLVSDDSKICYRSCIGLHDCCHGNGHCSLEMLWQAFGEGLM